MLSNYLINLSNTDASITKVTHGSTTQTGSNAITDYRYIGANPNNYVCLESSGSCTEDNLYRIIGVIPTQSTSTGSYENRVKLIKYTSYGNYYWSGSSSNKNNNWTASTLNTSTLNITYWNSISSYQKYIGDTKWYLGVHESSDGATRLPENLYKAERGTTKAGSAPISTISKIGLMYPSDYGYATAGGTSQNRNQCLARTMYSWDNTSYTNCRDNDWLKVSNTTEEWLLTPSSTAITHSHIMTRGIIAGRAVSKSALTIRPCFNLKSNVIYKSGTGTISNPYRLSVN